MEAKENTITKSVLQKIHKRHQLRYGESDNVQKDAIITTLGGIDQILSDLLESNADIDQTKLLSLQHIIAQKSQQTTITNNGDQPIEDKGYKQKLEFKFNDSDIFLFSIFNKQTATNIIQILNSKVTISVLAMLISTYIILNILNSTGVVSYEAYYSCQSVLMFIIFIYCFGWVTYCNTAAMKLLLKTFEFWFKLFYLFIYLVAFAVTKAERVYGIHSDPYPIHLICTEFLFDSVFLGLVMMFDSINIKQSNKLIIISFAVAIFANNALYLLQMSFYRNEYDIYEQLTVTIPDFVGVGSITFNYIDIAANSAQILSIFLIKQMIASIRNPKKALVIKSKPLMIYENNKETKITKQSLTIWKRTTISFWAFGLLFSLWTVVNVFLNEIYHSDVDIIVWIIIFLFVIFGIYLLNTAKIKYLYMANVVVFVIMVIFVVCSFLLKWPTMYVMGPFIGFGFSATYALKFAQKGGNDDVEIEKDKCETEIQLLTELQDTEGKSENKSMELSEEKAEIEMQTVAHKKQNDCDVSISARTTRSISSNDTSTTEINVEIQNE